MKQQTTLVTRKGQVTIPAIIRQALGIKEGDSVEWLMENDQVHLRRSSSVVARTAGLLRDKEKARTAEDERAAVELVVAEEVTQRTEE